MLRGNRLYFIALGLILSSPSYAQKGKTDEPPAQGNINTQLERIAAAIEKYPVTTAPDGGCPPGQDNYQSDLCAQWKAADAAANSADWAWWTMVAGFIGLILGGGTLFAAWRAAHWASEAAKETKRTADLADSHFLAQQKPYLFAEIEGLPFRPEQIAMFRPGEVSRHVLLRPVVKITNYSDMPARIIDYKITAERDGVVQPPQGWVPSKIFILPARASITLEDGRMPSGAPPMGYDVGFFALSPQNRDDFMSNPPSFFGVVTYTDHIGTKYEMGFGIGSMGFGPSTEIVGGQKRNYDKKIEQEHH